MSINYKLQGHIKIGNTYLYRNEVDSYGYKDFDLNVGFFKYHKGYDTNIRGNKSVVHTRKGWNISIGRGSRESVVSYDTSGRLFKRKLKEHSVTKDSNSFFGYKTIHDVVKNNDDGSSEHTRDFKHNLLFGYRREEFNTQKLKDAAGKETQIIDRDSIQRNWRKPEETDYMQFPQEQVVGAGYGYEHPDYENAQNYFRDNIDYLNKNEIRYDDLHNKHAAMRKNAAWALGIVGLFSAAFPKYDPIHMVSTMHPSDPWLYGKMAIATGAYGLYRSAKHKRDKIPVKEGVADLHATDVAIGESRAKQKPHTIKQNQILGILRNKEGQKSVISAVQDRTQLWENVTKIATDWNVDKSSPKAMKTSKILLGLAIGAPLALPVAAFALGAAGVIMTGGVITTAALHVGLAAAIASKIGHTALKNSHEANAKNDIHSMVRENIITATEKGFDQPYNYTFVPRRNTP